eukprot:762119_1
MKSEYKNPTAYVAAMCRALSDTKQITVIMHRNDGLQWMPHTDLIMAHNKQYLQHIQSMISQIYFDISSTVDFRFKCRTFLDSIASWVHCNVDTVNIWTLFSESEL